MAAIPLDYPDTVMQQKFYARVRLLGDLNYNPNWNAKYPINEANQNQAPIQFRMNFTSLLFGQTT